jgi:hypothetical protein
MNELSPLADAGDWRPSPAELLADAAQHHLSEAVTDGQEAARHLIALTEQVALAAPQRHRLQQLAELVSLAAAGAELLLTELQGLA